MAIVHCPGGLLLPASLYSILNLIFQLQLQLCPTYQTGDQAPSLSNQHTDYRSQSAQSESCWPDSGHDAGEGPVGGKILDLPLNGGAGLQSLWEQSLRKCVYLLEMFKKNSSKRKLSSSFSVFGAENATTEKLGQTRRRGTNTIMNDKMKLSTFLNLLRKRSDVIGGSSQCFIPRRRQQETIKVLGALTPAFGSNLIAGHSLPIPAFYSSHIVSAQRRQLLPWWKTLKFQQTFIFHSCHIFCESRQFLRPALLLSDG